MTKLSVLLDRMEENRRQTLRFLDYLRALAAAEARERGTSPAAEEERLLAADPTGGRLGHIAWHLMHIAAYEEGSFGPPPRPELPAPPLAEIAERLAAAHVHLLALAAAWSDDTLDTEPPEPTAPGMTYRELLDSVVWHEPHHLNHCNENLRMQLVEREGFAGDG